MSKLDKKDINRACWRSFCYQWPSFNYETMQSAGFTRFIVPSLRKIYGDEVAAEKAQQYISSFYNSENTMAQIIHGATLALEESETPGVTDTAIALRTGLMGPFAGLGDSVFKMSNKVIFGSLAGYMALQNSPIGLFLCIAFSIFLNVFVRRWLFMAGYKQGVEFITTKQDLIKGITAAVTVLGLVVIGCMIPATVKVTTPLVFTMGDATQNIQDILDQIIPYLLPVAVTFAVYKALAIKKMTTVRMVWIVIFVCIVLTFFGIL